MRQATMRAGVLLAFLAAIWAASAGRSQAGYGPATKWCVRAYDGADDCSYWTIWQCHAAVWGTGGSCVLNPRFTGDPPPPRRARKRFR